MIIVLDSIYIVHNSICTIVHKIRAMKCILQMKFNMYIYIHQSINLNKYKTYDIKEIRIRKSINFVTEKSSFVLLYLAKITAITKYTHTYIYMYIYVCVCIYTYVYIYTYI